MRVFRFDREVSVPLEGGARVGRLADGSVHVEVVRVDGGGFVPGRTARRTALAAVVAGAGRVGDRQLSEGYGACFEPGEAFELTSEHGMTVLVIEGGLTLRPPAWVTQHIEVVEHDTAWAGRFEELCALVWPALEGIAVRIDHVGSTSVPGLAAKPVIDMDVVLASPDGVARAIERLAGLGYEWRGDLGVEGRQAFTPPPGLPAHHLYVVVEDNRAHVDHWLFRDTLRAEPETRARYAALKRRNAEEAAGDMDHYVEAKAAFVAEVLSRARAARQMEPVEYWRP